jgi:hypothetical protein
MARRTRTKEENERKKKKKEKNLETFTWEVGKHVSTNSYDTAVIALW